MFHIKLQLAIQSLREIGKSIEDFLNAFLKGIFLLLLIFAFIFFGIKAFASVRSFDSVVSSILPAMAGLSLGSSTEEVKEIVAKLLDSIQHYLDTF